MGTNSKSEYGPIDFGPPCCDPGIRMVLDEFFMRPAERAVRAMADREILDHFEAARRIGTVVETITAVKNFLLDHDGPNDPLVAEFDTMLRILAGKKA